MLKVEALKLKDEKYTDLLTQLDWDYDDMVNHNGRRDSWISFDCLTYNPEDDYVYCGIANFSNDIFYRVSHKTGKFECLNYKSIADTYDAKFHRSLELDRNGILWAATALLHDVDRYINAPGGAIIKYDTKSNSYQKICIPIPNVYIQSIVLDEKRQLIHGITFTPEKLFTYNIRTGEVIDHGLVGSGLLMGGPHSPALDSAGRVWGTWSVTRAFMYDAGPRPIRLFCLDPNNNEMVFHKHGLKPLGKYDNGCVDGIISGRDGFIYIGSVTGALYRLDPNNAKVDYLCKPVPGERMAGMAYGPDGSIYIACGTPKAYIVRFTPGPDTIEVLGEVYDTSINEGACQIHDICIADDGTIYAGENDNFQRSSYLWKCSMI